MNVFEFFATQFTNKRRGQITPSRLPTFKSCVT